MTLLFALLALTIAALAGGIWLDTLNRKDIK